MRGSAAFKPSGSSQDSSPPASAAGLFCLHSRLDLFRRVRQLFREVNQLS
jgi:hypothetical protein